MKYLQHHWRFRVFILVLISCVISILMVGLELTDWAEQVNQQGFSHGEAEGGERKIPVILMYILPFIKEIILIGVPLLLTLLWIKIFGKFKHISK